MLSLKSPARADQVYRPALALAQQANRAQDCARCHLPVEAASADGACWACHGLATLGESAAHGEPETVYGTRSRSGCAYPVKKVEGFGTPALCKSCHDGTHGQSGAFAAWSKTDYKDRNITCIDCHMEGQGGATVGHRFSVGDADWLERSLELSIRSPRSGSVEVRAMNGGAGHGVLPEACELRELRVTVDFIDAQGRSLRHLIAQTFGCPLSGRAGEPLLHFEAASTAPSTRLEPSIALTWSFHPSEGWKIAQARFEYYRVAPRFINRFPHAQEAMKPVIFGQVELRRPAPERRR